MYLKIVSEDTYEPLPFSVIRVENVGVRRSDSLGIVSLAKKFASPFFWEYTRYYIQDEFDEKD